MALEILRLIAAFQYEQVFVNVNPGFAGDDQDRVKGEWLPLTRGTPIREQLCQMAWELTATSYRDNKTGFLYETTGGLGFASWWDNSLKILEWDPADPRWSSFDQIVAGVSVRFPLNIFRGRELVDAALRRDAAAKIRQVQLDGRAREILGRRHPPVGVSR